MTDNIKQHHQNTCFVFVLMLFIFHSFETTASSQVMDTIFYHPHGITQTMSSRAFTSKTEQTVSFGAQLFNSLESEDALDLLSEAGVNWVRIWVSWDTIEPTNTTPEYYNWTELDNYITAARARGFNILLTLSDQPSWAAEYPMGPVYDTDDIIEFFSALVERYDGDGEDDASDSPVVLYYEIYNEPDNKDPDFANNGGGYWGYNGAGYAELLQQLYQTLKASNQDAQLVFGGLALEGFEDVSAKEWFDLRFLDDVLTACKWKNCFDIMNFHYYPGFRSVWEHYGRDIIGKSAYVREKLNMYGFTGMPIICTETGWGSSIIGMGALGSVELQSQYVVKVYARSKAADLSMVLWYKDDDVGDLPSPGLLDDLWQPKPAHLAYKTLTSILGKADYQRPLSFYETGSMQIEGYIFQSGSRRIDVVWKDNITDYNAVDQEPLMVSASLVRVVDKFGNELWLRDGDDGIKDQMITVMVGSSPLYIEYYQ